MSNPSPSPVTTAPPRHRPGLPGRLAGWCHDRRRLVLGAWLATLVVAVVVSGIAGSNFQDKLSGSNTESQRARDLLTANFPSQAGDSAQIVFRADGSVSDPDIQARIRDLGAQVATLPHVAAVRGPFDPGVQGQVSPGGQIAYTDGGVRQGHRGHPEGRVQQVVDTAEAAAGNGLQVELGGEAISKVDQATPGASELIGIARGHRHPAGRLRLGHRHGPADRHRAVRHRHRRLAIVGLLSHVVDVPDVRARSWPR